MNAMTYKDPIISALLFLTMQQSKFSCKGNNLHNEFRKSKTNIK